MTAKPDELDGTQFSSAEAWSTQWQVNSFQKLKSAVDFLSGSYRGHHTYFFVAFSAVSCYHDVMARLARVVVPGVPHHITQRGNRRQATFFSEADYAAYLELIAEWCGRCGVAVWAYCLMPNHVHLIVVPESEDGLRQ